MIRSTAGRTSLGLSAHGRGPVNQPAWPDPLGEAAREGNGRARGRDNRGPNDRTVLD